MLREVIRESVRELVPEVRQGVVELGSCHLLVVFEVVHTSIVTTTQDMRLVVVGGPLVHALHSVL